MAWRYPPHLFDLCSVAMEATPRGHKAEASGGLVQNFVTIGKREREFHSQIDLPK